MLIDARCSAYINGKQYTIAIEHDIELADIPEAEIAKAFTGDIGKPYKELLLTLRRTAIYEKTGLQWPDEQRVWEHSQREG